LLQAVESNGQWVALLDWGPATWKLADREEWIGWTPQQKAQRLRRGAAAHAVSGAGGGGAGVVREQERRPQHAHRVGQIARGDGAAFCGVGAGAALGLYLPDQGVGE
ncbi:MAG: DUF4338 domain-containing protein, partial [Verrucomicrobia bacterium]|nr:DUF4338 domain-containing protein [Verrucomicrobiota bacterium]